jgi:signal transduction histidine kinase
VDAALEKGRDGAPELAQEVEGALTFVREFHPDAISMLVDASIDVQDRVAEIADCVKGIVSEPTFEWVDPRQVIARVCKPQERVAETAGVALCVEIPDEVPLVPADQKRLFSAVYNLVNNAIPATPAGGTVTIHLEVAPDGDFPEGHCLVIQVIDTGSGMPEEVRAKLFTEDAISTKVGGTGLGTRIVKNAVDAHGGVVTVESELGHGSVFCMRLPLERAGMPPPSA